MKKRFFRMVSVVLMLTLLVGSTNAFAAEASSSETEVSEVGRSFTKMNQIAENSVEVSDAEKIDEVKEIVNESIEDNNVVLNYQSAILDFSEAKLLDITCGNEVYTSITIPVEGYKYSLISNVTFVIYNNQIAAYTEALITKGTDDKFVIDTYYNGSLIESNHTDIAYMSDSEIQSGLNAIHDNVQKGNEYVQTRGVPAIAGCLVGVLGVNATVAYLIAGTCIASCPAVVPICVACIAGVCTIGAADVAAVVGCFSL